VTNIASEERMYRLGVAIDLVAAPANIVLAAALYVLLRPVHRHVARVALLWRVGEAVSLTVITLASFVTLELVNIDPPLAAAFVDAHVHGYAAGLIYTIIVFPDARQVLMPACYAPIGAFERTIGVWLLARPDRPTARS
jgi:hypothetical protein